jgi:hypothetical protein
VPCRLLFPPIKLIFIILTLFALSSQSIAHEYTSINRNADQQLISCNYRNISLRSALLDLARRFHVSLGLNDQITGYVSVTLHQATLDAALAALLNPLGYVSTKHHGVIFIQRSLKNGIENGTTSTSEVGANSGVII